MHAKYLRLLVSQRYWVMAAHWYVGRKHLSLLLHRVMSPKAAEHPKWLDLVCGVLQEADVLLLDRPQPRFDARVEGRHLHLVRLLALAEVFCDFRLLARAGDRAGRYGWPGGE